MEKLLIHHTKLEELYKQYMNEQTEEHSGILIAEVVRLTAAEAEVITSGVGEEGSRQPGGYYSHDGRFYYHVFSGMERFRESGFSNPLAVKISQLFRIAFQTGQVGGISLNYRENGGALLIPKEDIADGLAIYEKLHRKGQKDHEE